MLCLRQQAGMPTCSSGQLHSGRWWAAAGQQQQPLHWQVWPAGQLGSLRRCFRLDSMHPPRGATKGQKEPSSSFFRAGVEPAASWPVVSACKQCLRLYLSTHEQVAMPPPPPRPALLHPPTPGLRASSGPYTVAGQMATRRQRSCWPATDQACISATALALHGRG